MGQSQWDTLMGVACWIWSHSWQLLWRFERSD